MGYMAEIQRRELLRMFGPESMGLVTVDVPYWDVKVCRNFLNGMCPHGLFANTRSDMGPCPRLHTERLKEEYEADLATAPGGGGKNAAHIQSIRLEFERNIFDFVNQCDSRIRHEYRKLDATPDENNRATQLMRDIGDLESAVATSMTEAETLGESGEVDASMKELEKMEALKSEKEDKEKELQHLRETAGAGGHQKLRVCDTCGARLSILDSDRRLADHFGGKMHLGYLEMRKMIESFKANPTPRNFALGNAAPASHEINGHSASDRPPLAPYGNGPPRSAAPSYPPVRQPYAPPTNAPSGPRSMMGVAQSFVPSRADGYRGDRDRDRDRERERERPLPAGPRSERDRRPSDREREPYAGQWDRGRDHYADRDRERYTGSRPDERRRYDYRDEQRTRRRSRSPGR